MNTSDRIRSWLDSLDTSIDAVAADPREVRQDQLLRRIFELAFPPEGLPDEIKFEAKGDAAAFEALAEAHRPYYLTSLTETRKLNPKTGETTTTSRLVLRLKNLSGVREELQRQGLIRRVARGASSDTRAATAKRSRGEYGKTVGLILKIRERLQVELDKLADLEQEASAQGDSELVRRYREERDRITCELESLCSNL